MPLGSERNRQKQQGSSVSRATEKLSGALDAVMKYDDQKSPGEFQTPFSTHTHPISYVTIP
jgi:hypothetical protein